MGDVHEPVVYKVLSTRAIVLFALAVIAGGAGVAVWLLLAFGDGTEADRASLEAIKTAGTIVVGTGGAAALWLAARRQRTTEIALRHQEQVAATTEADAAERRVTELYIKAVEQLGSDKAPVRQGGMYALERLAQTVPDQRQTIANVLCAYLRMPFEIPDDEVPYRIKKSTESPDANGLIPDDSSSPLPASPEAEHLKQEYQVRLTAQKILGRHLRPGSNPDNPRTVFWPNITLDLADATLVNLDLSRCHVKGAIFSGATFKGQSWFVETHFGDQGAWFGNARFNADTYFGEATFLDTAWFHGTQFHGSFWLKGAKFEGSARFDYAQFADGALMRDTKFAETPSFENAIAKLSSKGRIWPKGYVVTKPDGAQSTEAEDRTWGNVIMRDNDNDDKASPPAS